jgi:hypothetical protein
MFKLNKMSGVDLKETLERITRKTQAFVEYMIMLAGFALTFLSCDEMPHNLPIMLVVTIVVICVFAICYKTIVDAVGLLVSLLKEKRNQSLF